MRRKKLWDHDDFESAVQHVFENRPQGKSTNRARGSDNWTIHDHMKIENYEAVRNEWARITGYEPEMFPFTVSAVALCYNTFRKKTRDGALPCIE